MEVVGVVVVPVVAPVVVSVVPVVVPVVNPVVPGRVFQLWHFVIQLKKEYQL